MANNGQYPPGKSGNPRGRPPGTTKRGVSITEFRKRLSTRSNAVLSTIDEALKEDSKIPLKDKVKVALEVAKLLGTLDKLGDEAKKPGRPPKEAPVEGKPKGSSEGNVQQLFSNTPIG